MGVYCVIALVFVHAVLGHESQGTDDRAVKLPTCQEITSAIAINQLTLLKMMGGGSHPSTGMAEMEELREEAAARDAKLQEIEKVIEDLKGMIENDVQETLKGMASLEQELLTKVTSLEQELVTKVTSLEQELVTKVTSLEQELVTKVTSLEQELVTKVTSLEQELVTKVTSLEQELVTKVTSQGVAAQQAALRQEMTSEVTSLRREITSNVTALREEMAAQGRLLEKVHESTTCPDGWLRRESSCYLVDDTDRTWENSLEYCRGLGGDLAKITSAEEQEFIKAHWGTHSWYWIGLNDRETEGRFVWTDGTSPTYTSWDEGQPGGGGGEDCVYMYRHRDGKWHDNPCSGRLGAVCERPVHA